MNLMLEYFIKNLDFIKEWCNTLQHEDTDVIQPFSRIKSIKTPKETSLILPDVLNHSSIRGLALFELYPGCYVYPHNHKESSYAYIEDSQMIHVPWDGIPYKTTHIVLETNPDAYFIMENKKHTWNINHIEELDVINKIHWAENPGNTNIKFLYIDYYDY